MSTMPSLFVSHGAPTLPLEPDAPVARFLRGRGAELPRPRAVLAVSAHWESSQPMLGAAARPETIHDFYGFPAPLYELRYPAPGAPELAQRIADLLAGAGFAARLDPTHGLDHGAWVPLMLMYPHADIPVLQLSLQTALGPAHHLALGAALRPLRDDDVLVLGSGGATHNLREFRGRGPDSPAPGWVTEFAEWLAAAVAADRRDDLIDYRRCAPHGARNHPSEEHLLPLLVAMGAGSTGRAGVRAHSSNSYGILAMDCYRFD